MRQKSRSQRGVAELAKQQHGVVAGRQLVRIGYSPSAVSRAVRAGLLHRLHHDVYAVGHVAISRHGFAMAAVLAAGDGSLLSHRSAAWLWGLTSRWANPIEVTATSPRRVRAKIRIHSAQALQPEDRDLQERVPVTTVPRTLLDFAASDHFYLPYALDNAHRLGLLDLIAMDALLTRSKGFRGVARLRTQLEYFRPRGITRSRLERRFRRLIREAGLPRPATNLFIEGFELDVYWPHERFAVELDTYDYHGDPKSFETDRLRHEELKLAGIEMVRVTGERLDREPGAVMRRIERLLDQRRRQLRQFAQTDFDFIVE